MERTSPALQQRRSGGAPGPAPPWAGEWARCRGNGRVGATCFLGYGLGGVHLGVLPLSPSCPPAPSSHGVARCGWIISAGHVMNPWHCRGGQTPAPPGSRGCSHWGGPCCKVGDTPVDIAAGRESGGCGVGSGGAAHPTVEPPSPPFYTPAELLAAEGFAGSAEGSRAAAGPWAAAPEGPRPSFN